MWWLATAFLPRKSIWRASNADTPPLIPDQMPWFAFRRPWRHCLILGPRHTPNSLVRPWSVLEGQPAVFFSAFPRSASTETSW